MLFLRIAGWGGGGRWALGGLTRYISMGRDVLRKGVLFSESLWNGGCVSL